MKRHAFTPTVVLPEIGWRGFLYWTLARSRRRPLCAVCRLDMHATPHRRLR